MKRNKLTNFILKNLRWTGMFLWEQVYFSRLNYLFKSLKTEKDIERLLKENPDLVKSFSKENSDNRTLYKVEVYRV